MIVQRTEQIIIDKDNIYYEMLNEFCILAKNLYNHANCLVRKEFIATGNWLRGGELIRLLRNDLEYPDYRNMPTSQCAQHVIDSLDLSWKSFFVIIKDWAKHKDAYLGRPNLPKYKAKNVRIPIILSNQDAKFRNNVIDFPKSFNGLILYPKCIYRKDFISGQQVRFIPRSNYIVAEVVYRIEISDEIKDDNCRYLSVDIGVDNLAAIANNFGENPVLINGKGLKSINQYYNKTAAYYYKIAKQMNGLNSTNRCKRLSNKRHAKVKDYIHKVSRYIVNYAQANNVCTIVIGYNKQWKQMCDLGRRNNQNFIQIPFNVLIEQIQYKAQELGIQVSLTEESYTSGTSYLDNEMPTKENYNKNRRIHRGLFMSNVGIVINADVNAAYQILKKVFPNAYANGIEVTWSSPVKVNIV